ncbi:uncharacterized protein DUF748 [Salegentibacter sp. 24]|nr:uncharacterized protein DUF748 [Salegentibacter sp. 24]
MMSEKNKRKRHKKRYVLPVLIVSLLIVGRIALPYILENYVTKTLNKIPGYKGSVSDIDLSLWRGAYQIEGLILREEKSQGEKPLLDFPSSDISIDWRSLLKGKIVSEVEMQNPQFNYIFENQQKQDQADVEDWTKALTNLVPIDINHFVVYNGTANFVEVSADPQISLFLKEISLEAHNLSNVVDQQKDLPSHLWANAISMGGGDVKIHGDLNLLKQIPDMDMEFSLQKAEATALNDLTRRYAGVDFESGTFELYSELAIADGYLKGYIKPMLINTKLIAKDDQGGLFKKLWEGFIGFFKFALKNQSTDTLATRVPLEGDLNNVDSGIWATVLNIFKNAWIEAFSGSIDEDIEFKDAVRNNKDS